MQTDELVYLLIIIVTERGPVINKDLLSLNSIMMNLPGASFLQLSFAVSQPIVRPANVSSTSFLFTGLLLFDEA